MMHPWLEWQERPSDAGVVLSFIGQVDLATIDDLRAALHDHVASEVTLIADLAGVWFMSVAGAEALSQTGRELRGLGGRFVVWRPQPTVERVIHLIDDDALNVRHGPLAAGEPNRMDEP